MPFPTLLLAAPIAVISFLFCRIVSTLVPVVASLVDDQDRCRFQTDNVKKIEESKSLAAFIEKHLI